MSLKCVGLVPLVLVFGVVLTFAQSVDHNCRDPILPDGYFLPLESEASAQAVITYACERGHKPAAQGWWATSRCQGNAWIPEPRCIDEKACLPPTVPNSEQPKDPQRWYENGHVIWVTCEKGYEHKDRKTTAKCENGSWSTLPVCERDPDSCGAPPQVPHAIIVGHDYQKVYPSDSHVTYQCEDGFTSMQSDSATKVFCIAGSWSETPVCKRPVVDPETDGKVTEPEVRECGNPPSIENGYYVGQDKMTLTYECHAPYTLDGPNTVVCSNNGLWSELPTCKARSDCQIRPGRYHDGLEILQEILLNDGHGLTIRCYSNLYRIVRCDNRKITYTSCCGDWYFQHNYCPARFTPY